MLVLSRKPGESIQIGPDVIVTVVQMGGGSVRLAFEAPREVPIRRSELMFHSPLAEIGSDSTPAVSLA